MDDLISRQKALDHLRKRIIQTANNNVGFVCDAGSTFEDASERVKTWLDEVPPVDAVPVKHAKLLDASPVGLCSECGFMMDYREEFNYCPNCGAIMDGDTYETN